MGRMVSHTELLEAVAADREAGLSIALANGCFDLLHVGHIRYLAGAAAEADRLVVAINSDESVTALKGPGQPVLPEAGRSSPGRTGNRHRGRPCLAKNRYVPWRSG